MKKHFTGYPSIDKPWLKYYSDKALNAYVPKCSIYEYMYENNKNYLDSYALNYFGKRITYGKLFENIENTSRAFLNIGIKAGDVVTVMLSNTPETIYTIYALNLIGAIGNLQYPTSTEKSVLNEMFLSNSKTLVILDSFYETYKNAAKYVENVIIISPWFSLPVIKKLLYKIKVNRKKIPSNARMFNKLNHEGTMLKKAPYKENSTALILHSGGTTGIPKSVELTNENINSIALQYAVGGMKYNRGESFMHTIPPFHAFGFSVGVQTPLCLGLELFASVKFDTQFLGKYFYDNKPNHFVSSGSIVKSILRTKDTDMSFLKNIAIGGTSLPKKDVEAINNFLQSKNCSAIIATGYGMSELCATVCTERNDCYKEGSIGIPIAKANIKVLSVDTNEELTYGQIGELCFNSPGIMKGYYKNENATKDIIDIDKEGNKWLHTGDLGYIEKDGFVYITGRIKRMVTTKDKNGTLFKLFPDYIEQVISDMKTVKECAVISVPHKTLKNVAIVFVIPENDNSDISKKIRLKCHDELPSYSQPYRIKVMGKIPKTPVGKIDYKKLEQII